MKPVVNINSSLNNLIRLCKAEETCLLQENKLFVFVVTVS